MAFPHFQKLLFHRYSIYTLKNQYLFKCISYIKHFVYCTCCKSNKVVYLKTVIKVLAITYQNISEFLSLNYLWDLVISHMRKSITTL